jgi:hypothetical protein
VVWRRRRSCGRTQTDSRIMENTQRTYLVVLARWEWGGEGRGRIGEVERNRHTSMNPQSYFFLKIIITIGARTAEPTKHAPPNFQAFSLSLVRAYTLIIRNMMYNELRM